MVEEVEIDGIRYSVLDGVKRKLCQGTTVDENGARPCRKFSIRGRDYCANHGGKSLIGPEHPAFITGLSSRNYKRFSNVGKELLQTIELLRQDPELFSLKDDAAFVTAIMDKRAEAAGEGVGIDQYKKVQAAYGLAHSKLGSPDFIDAFESIGDVLSDTLDMYSASRDVMELIDKRIGIVKAEQEMMQAKAYTLEVDQAFSLAMQLLDIVKDNVRNAEELIAIRAGVQRLLKVYKAEDEDTNVIDAEVVDESA
jgi:hypothetical protein